MPERQRSGAHRPRRSTLTDLVPAVLILLAVAGVTVGTVVLQRSTAASVSASGGPADSGDADGGSGATAAPPGTSSPTTSPDSTPAGTTPAGTAPAGTAPAGTAPAATATPTTADRSLSVAVLNGTARSGLAGRAGAVLRAAGWSVTLGNDRSQLPTTVYYPNPTQQASAQAVAADLGGDPAVEQSGEYGDAGLTVLLGPDYVESSPPA